jgi:hypothetical protein
MPWRHQAMKGAASCDKLRGAAYTLWSEDARMGKPNTGNSVLLRDEFIVPVEQNAEKWNISVSAGKERESIPSVVASESGTAQTIGIYPDGVVGPQYGMLKLEEPSGKSGHRGWQPRIRKLKQT